MEVRFQQNVSLKLYNTFGIEAKARYCLELHDEETVREVIADHFYSEYPLLILGGGSNVLFTKDFEGIVLLNRIKGKEVIRENDQYIWLRIGAGEDWHELVEYCLKHEWGGIENLSLIPGLAGAAPIQNIGAYGVELKDVFDSLEAIDLVTGVKQVFSKDSCNFGYRDSLFKQEAKGRYLITRVILRLQKAPHHLNTSYGAITEELEKAGLEASIHSLSKVICKIRQRKLPDPAVVGNAGSFFKNPLISKTDFEVLTEQYPQVPHYLQESGEYKVPAAWLIQTTGWKGVRRGNFGVHPNQALVLVNYGKANGEEIYQLSKEISDSVYLRFGISLEREVNIL